MKEQIQNRLLTLNSRIKSGPYQLLQQENLFFLVNENGSVMTDFYSEREMNAYLQGLLHREFI